MWLPDTSATNGDRYIYISVRRLTCSARVFYMHYCFHVLKTIGFILSLLTKVQYHVQGNPKKTQIYGSLGLNN